MMNFGINRLAPRNFGINRQIPQNNFGLNFPMPMGQQKPSPISFQPPPTIPTTAQPPKQPYNLAEEYAKIDRPNRLAYQQGVEEGAPIIERSKWARLGTALGAGGLALGGTPASDAIRLGVSAYEAPQIRSNQRYKERMEGLGNLATMEESDAQNKLKALESQNSDWFKQQDLGLRTKQDIREENLNRVQMLNLQDELDHRGEVEITGIDGITKIINRKGDTVRTLGQTKLTAEQQKANDIETEGGKAVVRAGAEAPFRMAELDKSGANALAVARENNASRETIAANKVAATAEGLRTRLKAAANKPNASEDYKRMLVNLDRALVDDPSLSNYVKQAVDGSYVPKEKSDFYFFDADDQKKLDKVRSALLAGPMTGSQMSVAPGARTTSSGIKFEFEK